ncbi:TPA: hypothetical protein QCQ43_003497 [Bacillus cereus]|uniref:hypothetical protein n=1 Tax=Bacillus cereus TaxID=1396 RepID=UPI0011455035|nr:hypothetical protein [Bacillus cereus]HDR4537287.1 hypothetical protein [Bacillus cereus]
MSCECNVNFLSSVSHDKSTLDKFNDIRLMRHGTLTSFKGTTNELTNLIRREGISISLFNSISNYHNL